MRRNYRMKKTISMKQFISEFGENFSEHTKKRLLELEVPSVLTRKQISYVLDLKHVEHTKYDCSEEDNSKTQKEYVYGQFIVLDDVLYFSNNCIEDEKVMKSPIVDQIYNSLKEDEVYIKDDIDTTGKKIDDNNIDFIIDTIFTVFPEVSQRYLDIVEEMLSHSR
ncbi:hypothetical protein D4Z93_06385 [Clostridium fermenticellae]|uniref:Uncharacterized protein n=1 Tax=Clostridium fermenticellae TaxID=2068654 RepID=A0A386H3V1_9CLOT|nr:hypothetical protein [Clostridium fermenticellae]AYD40165.1 hypothetical protein D4Z93_06385 [Clostridium fermenticellae]